MLVVPSEALAVISLVRQRRVCFRWTILGNAGRCVVTKQLDIRPARQSTRGTISFAQISQDYLACLKDNSGDASECRDLSKLYLQCRMDRNLMAKQDLTELGFRSTDKQRPPTRTDTSDSNAEKQKQGFVAGIRR